MEKILRYSVWAGVLLILLGIASCNIPFFTPGDEDTPVSPDVPTNPDAPSNTDGAETILIPAAIFWMGSETADTLADDDETPQHQVTLNGFYIYTHEVTNGMYAECVAAGGCLPVTVMESGPTTHYGDPAYADYPVVGVDWNMADDYCTWAGGRLPTEAEWERAARGTDSLLYPWGEEDPACDRVNMLGCAIPPDAVEVGSYLNGNSPEGVWDLSGNVWEWVHDWYAESYYLFSPDFNPLGPNTYQDVNNPLKVARGGGLYSEPGKLRGAERAGADPYRAYDDVGFRCVAGEGLPLSEGYVPPLDRHEMVPPDPLDGGGEPLDDPDRAELLRVGFDNASCPTPDGRVHIVIEVTSSEELEYSVSVEGIHFDCYFDDALHLLHCEGPVPESTEHPGLYHAEVSFGTGGVLDNMFHALIEIPTDCPAPPPDRFSIDLECPDDGLFTITFFYDPPITWDIVRIVTHIFAEDIPCVQITDNEIRCTAPDIRFDDHYEFILQGTDSSGNEYTWFPWVPVRDDCPVHFVDADLTPLCFEDHSAVQVTYLPEVMGVASVSVGDTLLDCIGMAPGVQICGDLPGSAGDLVEVTICTETGACFTETIEVSGCPGTAHIPGFLIEPYCYPPEAPAPAVSIHYWPFDQHLVATVAGDTALRCSDWGGGWYICPGVPGTPGETVNISACLEDGRCFTGPMIVPDCGAPGEEDGWRMSAIGCHDVTRIYFMIDTGLDWLIPGAEFDYTATDGETTYACTVNPAMPGRIYCAGTRPEVPGPLEFCLQRPGEAAPTCQTYPNYNIWVAGIPPCAPEEPVEPEEPTDPCAVHTDPVSCNTDKPACVWVYTDPQHCESNPNP
ncbi:MAG: formylglycine-generating enzyme family protein [Chloroflexi bacterium]|nr:formylglycine-generating enzyme family protein [Chloroflexota bacterium]